MYFHSTQSLEAHKVVLDLEDPSTAVLHFYAGAKKPLTVFVHQLEGKKMEFFTNMDEGDKYVLMEQVYADDDTSE